MADQDRRISGPVTVVDHSVERVALDLAYQIAQDEGSSAKKDRQYWLTLYRQCYKATRGNTLESILKQD